MRSLEQTICECTRKAEANRELAKYNKSHVDRANDLKNAEECEQLAEWLRELQERRKQPEIIKCKDCAYYDWDCVDVPYGMTKMICWCDLHYDAGNENLVVNPDDFCSRAERRTE